MTDRYKDLRDALAAGPKPGPWYVQSSNSWRRIGTQRGDGDVLAPTTQTDGHPDLAAPHETLAYIAACHPEAIRALLAERDALREALKCIAQTRTKPGDDKAALLLASVTNLAFAALAQEQGETDASNPG